MNNWISNLPILPIPLPCMPVPPPSMLPQTETSGRSNRHSSNRPPPLPLAPHVLQSQRWWRPRSESACTCLLASPLRLRQPPRQRRSSRLWSCAAPTPAWPPLWQQLRSNLHLVSSACPAALLWLGWGGDWVEKFSSGACCRCSCLIEASAVLSNRARMLGATSFLCGLYSVLWLFAARCQAAAALVCHGVRSSNSNVVPNPLQSYHASLPFPSSFPPSQAVHLTCGAPWV